MSQGKICEIPCDACNKKGLPIYPVRYAVAPLLAKAPPASGQFKSPAVSLSGDPHYTTRLLRSGYLYVYDEARKRLEGYVITALGYYVPFDVELRLVPLLRPGISVLSNPKTPIIVPGAVEPEGARALDPCARDSRAEIAGFITISTPTEASIVWLGFSEVKWTPALIEKHKQEVDWRRKHMRRFDVKAWMNGNHKADHVNPIAELHTSVAEHGKETRDASFQAYTDDYNATRKSRTGEFIRAANNLWPDHGAIVALEDPVGMAKDLAGLAAARLQFFIGGEGGKEKDRPRKLSASNAITGLRGAIENQAEHLLIAEAEDARVKQRISTEGAIDMSPDLLIKDPTPAQLDRANKNAWDKYPKKYDEPARENWQKSYDQQLAKYTETTLNPLAEAHVKWMQSDAMRAFFECNYDQRDPHSGAGYTATMNVCVKGTAGLKACFDFYLESLKPSNELNTKNIVLRALIFNQADLADAARSASEIDKRIVPWDNVYGPYKIAVERMGGPNASQLTKLLYELCGPIAKLLDAVIDGSAKLVVMGAVSLHAGKPWARVTLTGSYEKFRELLVKKIVGLNGDLSSGDVKRVVAKEIKRLGLRGELNKNQHAQNWLVLLDEKEIRGLPKGSIEDQLKWLQGHMKTPEAVYALQVEGGVNKFKNVFNAQARLGVASGILQIVCFTKLVSDAQNAMAADEFEAWSRLAAGMLSIAGTVCEVGDAMMPKLPRYASSLAAGKTWPKLLPFLEGAGRVLGVMGGLIMAAWDLYKAYDELKKGNRVVATLYVGSFALGLAVTIGFFLSWNPVLMLILVACLVLVAWLLETYKDNKLQSWLEQCIFGKGAHYASAELERREFALALK